MSLELGSFSVLISVYKKDDPKFLNIALRSVYDNQILKPEQIVIVADGPLQRSQMEVIEKICDDSGTNVVTLVELTQNVGLAAALNEGLKQCRNELVARMDADDISLPERFAKQIEFMHGHPDIDVCGTLIAEIDTDTEAYISTRKVPLSHDNIILFARGRSAVNHPSVVFRKSKVLAVGGYPLFRKSQDFALWSLLIVNNSRFANIGEVLLQMRTGRDLMARRGLSHLKYELQVINFQYKIGFITFGQFIKFATIRTVFRILPGVLKKMLYKAVRAFQG